MCAVGLCVGECVYQRIVCLRGFFFGCGVCVGVCVCVCD